MSRFIKVGEDGAPADATQWVAVLDTTTNLMWAVEETKRMRYKDALKATEKLTTAGFKDWKLPTAEQLFGLADRTRYSPAIDTEFFPDCKSDRYWSSTVDASSPAVCAWLVDFYYGDSYWLSQDGEGFVRAVRAGQ